MFVNNIVKIFNSEDQSEIKQAFKNLIISQFQSELEELGEYFFNKSVVEDMIHETFEDVLVEVKKEIREIIREKMLDSLDIKKKNKKTK